jgi:hypothetical protein
LASFQPTHFLVQLLLPTRDNEGQTFSADVWEKVKDVLLDRFGGLTAYTRSPAEGFWAPTPGQKWRDDVFIVEVIAENLDRQWWRSFKAELEVALRQEQLVVRALPMDDLSGE